MVVRQEFLRRRFRDGGRYPRARRQCKSLPMHHGAVNRSLRSRDKVSRSSGRNGPRGRRETRPICNEPFPSALQRGANPARLHGLSVDRRDKTRLLVSNGRDNTSGCPSPYITRRRPAEFENLESRVAYTRQSRNSSRARNRARMTNPPARFIPRVRFVKRPAGLINDYRFVARELPLVLPLTRLLLNRPFRHFVFSYTRVKMS